MRKSLYKLTEDMEIQKNLYPKVISAIETSKRRGDVGILCMWTLISLLFSPITFYLLFILHKKLIESSTYEYISLLVNDADARSLYSKEILFAVYDTIPLTGATITLISFIIVIALYFKTLHLFSMVASKKLPAY